MPWLAAHRRSLDGSLCWLTSFFRDSLPIGFKYLGRLRIQRGMRCLLKRNEGAVLGVLLVALAASAGKASVAQKAQPGELARTPLVVRAAGPYTAPGPTDFDVQYATSPAGKTIGMNARYLTLNGKPWLPVMGEFHYARVPEAEWQDEILKMKAAGVQIVSTYVFWIFQEEEEGRFDWSGQRNLRRFVELCQKNGMYVWLRIGPWDHGEVRNGGFPNWLVKKIPARDLRRDDPEFMRYVGEFFHATAAQVEGLMWNEGGPILGLQLGNEYALRGPGAGDAYILALKKLAVASGFHVPIYSVTGWDHAVAPRGAVVALYGAGYPDQPWSRSIHQLPAGQPYEFRFDNRVSGKMSARGEASSRRAQSYGYPFMTAENGGGVEDTYHRRPLILPNDVAALMPVMLGSGVNLYGSYMFQGGINPDGKLTTLEESQATGYPNSLPVKDYDFQAPLTAFGRERQSLRKLKVFNYFLNDFGGLLAPMPVFAPEKIPSGPADFSVPRVAVRTNGRSGFLFFNNYVRTYPMPDWPRFQVKVELAGHAVMIPAKPVDLPSGDYGIWPFGLTIGCLHLRYATAELFTRTENGKAATYYFVATRGVPAQFVLERTPGIRLTTRGQRTEHDSSIAVKGLSPSLLPIITATDGGGQTTRIVLLSQKQAEDAWKLDNEHLLLAKAQFVAHGGTVTLERDGKPEFTFSVVPALHAAPSATAPLDARPAGAGVSRYSAKVPVAQPILSIRQIRKAGLAPPVRIGRKSGVARAPSDEAFHLAAKWRLEISADDWNGISKLFLVIDYDGDVARLLSGGKLLDDDFYNGRPWTVGLNRFRSRIEKHGLELEILPRRADAPIFLERRYRTSTTSGQVISLRSARLEPQYQLKVTFAGLPTDSR